MSNKELLDELKIALELTDKEYEFLRHELEEEGGAK